MLYHGTDRERNGVLVVISSKNTARYILCKTHDSHWLVGTLHEVMDEQGLDFVLNNYQTNLLRNALAGLGMDGRQSAMS
jgi:hypothetical protein